MMDSGRAQDVTYRWVYRNPFSILDPAAVDLGKGSRNGSVNSFTSDVPRSYQPRLRYNHMATLAHMPNGSISAQWQGVGKWFEGAQGQSVYWAVSNDTGLTWGRTEAMIPSPDTLPLWGPVVYSTNDTMHAWYSKSHAACQLPTEGGTGWAPGGDLLYSTSADNGKTWSNATDVIPYSTDGGIAKLSCNGVSLTRNGSWLLPIWREIGGGQPCQSVPKSAKALHGVAGVLLSDDQGKTFTEAAVPKTNTTWMIENAIARYSSPSNGTDMHVQLFRTRTGTTMQSWSTDEGKTWSFPQNSTLPNPNSRLDAIALPNNTLVVAYNDSPSKRSPLRLATSTDGGLTWTKGALIEDDPEGSFHYPALLYDAKKDVVMVVYTVSYPPRLIPVSLVLPSLDDQPANAPGPAPMAAPAASSLNQVVKSASLSSAGRAPGPAAGTAGSNGTNATRSGSSASGSGVAGVSFSTGRRLQAFVGNAVPASVLERPGGSQQMQEMDTSEVERNAQLGIQHAERLAAHGYRQVPGLPGYVLESHDRGLQSPGSGDPDEDSPRQQEGALRRQMLETGEEREGRLLTHQERRILKERFVKEQANFGRVNYGMRVAWVDRQALVTGQIFPK
ncbi:g4211 [Coccomyxa viridis]|uniref:G4211 protein n=1 Tax=Coccomyxa viridis TaxID=1274662 RepID=A0ABP1FRB1_9CHLO